MSVVFEKFTDMNLESSHLMCLMFDSDDEMGLQGTNCRLLGIDLRQISKLLDDGNTKEIPLGGLQKSINLRSEENFEEGLYVD